jgi:small-conductance mechanosensitive channel
MQSAASEGAQVGAEVAQASWLQAPAAPFLYPLALFVVLWLLDRSLSTLQRRQGSVRRIDWRWWRPILMIGLTLAGLVLWSVTLRGDFRSEYLKLLAAVLAGAVALAATSPIGNAFAGVMMRNQRHFRAGDWVESEGLTGRISERGIFFVEIQDERSNLVTVPNRWLASRPLSVIRCPPTPISPYTLVDAEITLGYDVPRRQVERLLAEAARSCALHEPWVQVCELGDFSVRYRVKGRTSDTQNLLRIRSDLRAATLDTLHDAGVEIVSPRFINQRVLDRREPVLPEPDQGPAPDLATDPDRDAFERASVGSEQSGLLATIAWFRQRIQRLEQVKERTNAADGTGLERRIEKLQAELDAAEQRRTILAKATEEKRSRDG